MKIANRLKKKNQSGQGMVEYLIIVAIIAIASISIVKSTGEVIQSRFHSIAEALQSNEVDNRVNIQKNQYSGHDMGNFMKGASSKKSN